MSETMTIPGAPPVRASDAERDQTAEILRAGYAEGRLRQRRTRRAGHRGLRGEDPRGPACPDKRPAWRGLGSDT
jgi:hypothetical protein